MKGMNCFAADSVVTTVTGQKRMDHLAIGDLVLVPSAGDVLKYERVEMFYHREPETRAQFVVLFTESKKRLALTPLHLLPFGECQEMRSSRDFKIKSIVFSDVKKADGVDKWMRASRFAEKASVGDCVLSVADGGEVTVERIVKVGRQVSAGIYSPMTAEGALIVDGVLSSCFSQVESHTVQKVYYRIHNLHYFGGLRHLV
ncbi:unnamed protein product [Nippostrongylus brasiliensis]|uniref:HintN domain-containing protein n=1 Tax=Nippostrongylus brasiliensis TaxID=27835 RepID=A0A0N4YW89_NIPBR|nr:unnamed protein product [Nippostrongylus brasiliensis]